MPTASKELGQQYAAIHRGLQTGSLDEQQAAHDAMALPRLTSPPFTSSEQLIVRPPADPSDPKA